MDSNHRLVSLMEHEHSALLMSAPAFTVLDMVKLDVEATRKLLDDLLSEPIRRSPWEEIEPDYEFLDPFVTVLHRSGAGRA
ncbi:hypothetical protein [Arthrobacter sp. PAMC25284]|uniref:hypothetical protein n=1 Tax=Arthrobacter sp. PAMC25284 TaxID=2861279 RepID=UPI001C637E6D|nr:hypothetical protein [Arthrobacter sp. PAMC25284]QYF89717.1 hypothetical protein KY499_17100 [Arthrobacter sp. PAMC25284]